MAPLREASAAPVPGSWRSRGGSASPRSSAARRMAPAPRCTTTLPSGARKATTAPPASCSSLPRTPRTRSASWGAIDMSPPSRSSAARSACRLRPRSAIIISGDSSPPPVSAQSPHGSPVISPSCRGWPTTAPLAGPEPPCASAFASGLKAASGWIQNLSARARPGTTIAPCAKAVARSSSPSTRMGAESPRTAEMPSPRASARSPTVPALTWWMMATTLPAWTVKCCPAVTGTEAAAPRAYWPTISCQRVAEPISGRASEPSGMRMKSAVRAPAGALLSLSRVRARRGGAGTACRARASWRSARASRASVMARRAGANGSRRAPGLLTAGIETWRTISCSSERATFFTSTATTSPPVRTK